jgi:hypothetical protein
MQQEYGHGVWYDPEAEVAHKVFDYRTKLWWLIDRAFWQGYSKRAMESFVDDEGSEERTFLTALMNDSIPTRVHRLIQEPSVPALLQLLSLFQFTVVVGFGYMYAVWDWDDDTLFDYASLVSV